MNSIALLQAAVSNWLSADDVAELSLTHTEALVNAVNMATARIWRQTPAGYRRTPWSQSFRAPATGTATVEQGSRSLSVSIPDVSLTSSEWQYCSIKINGLWNMVVNSGYSGSVNPLMWSSYLRDEWTGESGTFPAIIYHDAAIQPLRRILIERFIGAVKNRDTGAIYYPQGSGSPWFLLSRVRFPEGDGDDIVRSMLQVSLSESAVMLEGIAEVIPAPLGLVDASSARSLEVDDEICGIIAAAAGIELQRHPKFRGGSLDLAFDAVRQLDQIPKRQDTYAPTIGTPVGW